MTFLACPHNFKGLCQGKDLILRLRLENGLMLGIRVRVRFRVLGSGLVWW